MQNRFFRALALTAAVSLALAPLPACAEGVEIIRDAEIEQLLREYATPVLSAAGLKTGAVKIILVGDRSFNAFVANGQKIFVNVGALMEAKTPNETIGVLAHETGHIAGGHLARLRAEIDKAQIIAIAGMLLGGAAAATTLRRNGPVGSDEGGAWGAILGPQDHAWGEERYAHRSVMISCDFSQANLAGANLVNGIFHFAKFRDAGMRGALLAGADLTKADLTGADLTGADLTGANLEEADLSRVTGLATVRGLATIRNLDKAIR